VKPAWQPVNWRSLEAKDDVEPYARLVWQGWEGNHSSCTDFSMMGKALFLNLKFLGQLSAYRA
jgi:hypothetical protein